MQQLSTTPEAATSADLLTGRLCVLKCSQKVCNVNKVEALNTLDGSN